MPAEKATAIVLKTVEFMESSLVLTLFTREFGKVRALAKGARRLKGPFESALDLLALCRIVFLRKSSEALDLVTESKLLRRFRPAGHDLSSLYAGYYVAELLNELTDDYDPHPELFDLADESLAALSGGEPVAKRVLRFELVALRLLGHFPSLDTCVDCGARVPMTGRVAFGQLDGGVLCPECRRGKQQLASVSAGVLRVMEQLAEPSVGHENAPPSHRWDMEMPHRMGRRVGQAWRRLEIDPRSRGELRSLLNHYLCNLLGRRPRMHRYLSMLSS